MADFAASHNVTIHVRPVEGSEYQSFSQILCVVICQVVCVRPSRCCNGNALWNLGVKLFYSSGRSPCFPQSPTPTVRYYNESWASTSHHLVHSPSLTVSLSDPQNTPVETFDFSVHQCMSRCMLQYR